MKTTIISILLLFFILSCTQEKPVDIEMGENVFKTSCVMCHGQDGKLAINGAKDLALSTMTVEERIVLIRDGKNLMTPFKNLLKDEQIRAVAHYSLKFKNAN